MKRLIIVLCCLVVLSPTVVQAAGDCNQNPTNCLNKEDLYSMNNTSGWYDPALQNQNTCQSGVDGQTATDPNLKTTPVTFPTTATVDEKIAQTLVVGFNLSLPSVTPAYVESYVKQHPIGGLYLTNTSDAASKGFNAAAFQKINAASKTPLMISSDEEGTSSSAGLQPIHRFSYSGLDFPVAADMGAQTTVQIEGIGRAAGQAMKQYGITTDLAPVLDLDNGRGAADNSVISKYGRAFSADPNKVAAAGDAFAKGLSSAGVSSVYKHFPGLGSAWDGAEGNNTDAYKITGPSLAALQSKDLVPFQKLAGKNNAAVMLSNEYIPDWNGGSVPVSESPAAIQYLQTTLKFNGLIMTDSLTGPAKYQHGGSVAAAATQSELAGANMVLFEGEGVDLQAVINQIKQSSLLASGSSKLDASISKIIAFKNQSSTAPTTALGGAGCCSTSGANTIAGSSDGEANKPIIWSTLTGSAWGLTPAQAAGVMGNMQLESGFQPQRLQGTGSGVVTAAKDWSNINGGGWGLVQWTPGSKMINPTFEAKREPDQLGTQLDFLKGQLFGEGLGSSLPELRAGTDLKAATTDTPEKAADVFGYEFERFGTNSGTERSIYARTIYNQYVGNAPPPPNAVPTGTTDAPVDSGTLSSAVQTGCPGPVGDFVGDAGQLAQQILDKWDDVYTGTDDAKQDLADTVAHKDIQIPGEQCKDKIAKGGLDGSLLQTVLKLGVKYKLNISDFMRGHQCDGGAHPLGWAIDIGAVTEIASGKTTGFCDGEVSGANNPNCPNIADDRLFYSYLASVAPAGSILLQENCQGRGDGAKYAPGVLHSPIDVCNHEHFNVHQDQR